jgi:hypothetical protein
MVKSFITLAPSVIFYYVITLSVITTSAGMLNVTVLSVAVPGLTSYSLVRTCILLNLTDLPKFTAVSLQNTVTAMQ